MWPDALSDHPAATVARCQDFLRHQRSGHHIPALLQRPSLQRVTRPQGLGRMTFYLLSSQACILTGLLLAWKDEPVSQSSNQSLHTNLLGTASYIRYSPNKNLQVKYWCKTFGVMLNWIALFCTVFLIFKKKKRKISMISFIMILVCLLVFTILNLIIWQLSVSHNHDSYKGAREIKQVGINVQYYDKGIIPAACCCYLRHDKMTTCNYIR